MHEIEPFYRWEQFYQTQEDPQSPFYGKQYNYQVYSDHIYDHYIAPGWDFFGSETLYIKILYVDYEQGFTIMEFLGEWNDAIHNDIMHLKRNIVDVMLPEGVDKYILIGENVMNFHGSDDCYYEEWFEELEETGGWIAALNFRDFVMEEWSRYNVDWYINYGGTLQLPRWRTMEPQFLFVMVNRLIQRRISLT